MHDRHGSLVAALESGVLDGNGSVPAEVRRALAAGGEIPEQLAGYADQVRDRAWEITDADLAEVTGAGYSEDQVYEVTVAVALGEGLRRVTAGLAALEASAGRDPFPAPAGPAADAGGESEEPFTPTVAIDPDAEPLARRTEPS